jgi:hypothetical protein
MDIERFARTVEEARETVNYKPVFARLPLSVHSVEDISGSRRSRYSFDIATGFDLWISELSKA